MKIADNSLIELRQPEQHLSNVTVDEDNDIHPAFCQTPCYAQSFSVNKTYFGDCLEVMKIIPDNSVDLILCDLPFGSTANHWDVIIPFDKMWKQYKRIIKDGCPVVLFGTGLFAYNLALSNEKWFKYEIIWHKSKSGSSFTAKHRPVAKHENILVFGKGKVTYNPQLLKGEPYYRKRKANNGDKPNNHKLGVVSESETTNTGFRYPSTVQFFQQKWRRQDQLHSTQKPVELLEWLIRSYSHENDTVLDNCSGSGTTGLAAKNLNRKYIMIEKDYDNYVLSCNRVGETPIVILSTGRGEEQHCA